MIESLLTVLILTGGALITSTFGFGAALFAMPLLTLLLGIKTATPLYGLVGPTISTIILSRNWQRVDFSSAWRLLVSTFVGIPLGALLVRIFPGSLITQGLGICLIAFGLYRLSNRTFIKLKSSMWAFPFGFLAGVLGGAYNTSGPPVVIYGEMCRWTPTQFRATLQGYLLPTSMGILISHGLTGLWSWEIFQWYGLSLPAIVMAVAIGGWINQTLTVARFKSLLSGLLVLLGLLLLV